MFVAVEPTSVTRAVWVINVTCGGTAIYLRQMVFSVVGIAVSSIIGHIPGRQMCNKMCNTGFHKCNRITAEEWQSG